MATKTTKNICIFGDSIAYGAWDEEGGWVDRLREFLHQETLRSRFTSYYFVYHLGIPGDTTESVLKRMECECRAREPHVIIFAVGINDASYARNQDQPRVAFAQFQKNVASLLEQARGFTNTVVWIGLTRVDGARTMPFETTHFENLQIARYDEQLARSCAEQGAIFLDVSALLSSGDWEDGLHPNAEGHRKLFLAIRDALFARGVL